MRTAGWRTWSYCRSQPKANALEAVEQGDEPAAPIGVVQVDGVDPDLGEQRRLPFGTGAKP